ncbi:MAG: ECF transporter S component [bacterium]|nr:ECF transporter S component [bacterium]
MMNQTAQKSQTRSSDNKVRRMAVIAMMGAVSAVLMFFSFSVPFMPSFIKLDFSELPALIAAFALGPAAGAMVCLIKNLVNLFFSTTGGVGELSNFLLGVFFVVPAGVFYSRAKSRRSALVGALLGAVTMAVFSNITNYYIVYPVYSNFMPMDSIIKAYQVINPNVEGLWDCLLWFNMPFTFFKGMCSVVITFLVYKHLSPIIKGSSK